MSDFVKIFKFLFLTIIILLVINIIFYSFKTKTIYNYVDWNDNEGIAKECSYDSRGGQGAMVCVLEDNTVIQVKEYKKEIILKEE